MGKLLGYNSVISDRKIKIEFDPSGSDFFSIRLL